jgi:hypothetical protein
VLSGKRAEHFKQLLETRISDLNRVLTTAEPGKKSSGEIHAFLATPRTSGQSQLRDKAHMSRFPNFHESSSGFCSSEFS